LKGTSRPHKRCKCSRPPLSTCPRRRWSRQRDPMRCTCPRHRRCNWRSPRWTGRYPRRNSCKKERLRPSTCLWDSSCTYSLLQQSRYPRRKSSKPTRSLQRKFPRNNSNSWTGPSLRHICQRSNSYNCPGRSRRYSSLQDKSCSSLDRWRIERCPRSSSSKLWPLKRRHIYPKHSLC